MFCMGNNQQDNFQQDSTAKKIQNYIFKYQDLLGKGNFGSAYRGYDVNTGKQVAIKVIKMSSIKSKVFQQLLQNEIQILRELKNHLNLLKCYDVFTSVNNCYIITELCQYDLNEQMKKKGRFKEHEIKQIIYGVYKGLQQLGRNSIIHRDIKISNIFLNKNKQPKIADFGFAVKSSNKFKDLNIGSPLYMSPQGLIDHVYGPKTDVWSFGVFLYQLLHGQTPLERCTTDDQLKQQIFQPLRFHVPISSQLKQLMLACLTIDEVRRPTIFQLANFPYIRRLINQFQSQSFSSKQSSHVSTQCSEQNNSFIKNPYFFKRELSYQNTLSLLHYCRLLHKLNKKLIHSQKVSQFLLNLSFSLTKSQISTQGTFNEQLTKLKQVLHEYYNKYLMQYEDFKTIINPREIMNEIETFKRNQVYKPFLDALQVLYRETGLFISALESQNCEVFSKKSEAKLIIENNKISF